MTGMGGGGHTHTQTDTSLPGVGGGGGQGGGLTVNVHLKSVIFTVTGTVGTEAKALYFLCGSGEREASMRGAAHPSLRGWAGEEGSRKPLGYGGISFLPLPLPAPSLHPLTPVLGLAASFSSSRSQRGGHLLQEALGDTAPPPTVTTPVFFSKALTSVALTFVFGYLFPSLFSVASRIQQGQGTLFSCSLLGLALHLKNKHLLSALGARPCTKHSLCGISFNPHQSFPFYR